MDFINNDFNVLVLDEWTTGNSEFGEFTLRDFFQKLYLVNQSQIMLLNIFVYAQGSLAHFNIGYTCTCSKPNRYKTADHKSAITRTFGAL